MSKELVLTGLGNEVDLRTQRTVFTAVFNNSIRIEISKEAAQTLTREIFSERSGEARDDYSRPPEPEQAGDEPSGAPTLADTPGSVYEEDTGVEQV